MSDLRDDHAGEAEPHGSEGEATPRWVKLFALVALVIVVAVVVVLVVGGGHGPGRHASSAAVSPTPARPA